MKNSFKYKLQLPNILNGRCSLLIGYNSSKLSSPDLYLALTMYQSNENEI